MTTKNKSRKDAHYISKVTAVFMCTPNRLYELFLDSKLILKSRAMKFSFERSRYNVWATQKFIKPFRHVFEIYTKSVR